MEEENKLIVPEVDIKNMIYTIRGKQVMLDSDVAKLFEYKTKDLNRNVKNNIERFPEYYCFQLTKDELKNMWFQNGTTQDTYIMYLIQSKILTI